MFNEKRLKIKTTILYIKFVLFHLKLKLHVPNVYVQHNITCFEFLNRLLSLIGNQ